jgi:hypothetical protein
MGAQKTLAEFFPDLRRPFTAAAVKVKPLTKPASDGKSQAAFYIDARLVAERLNAVAGPENWSDSYRLLAEGREVPALYYPIECALTVCGVTKTDVGQGANTILDEKAWKSAYSDALKRAAVKFGVGAYLYAIPRLRSPVDVGRDGKAKGFTSDGATQLRTAYERWLLNPTLNTFGDPLDHGDMLDHDIEPAGVADVLVSDEKAEEIAHLIDELARGEVLDPVKVAEGMEREYGTALPRELTAEQAENLLARLRAKRAQVVAA